MFSYWLFNKYKSKSLLNRTDKEDNYLEFDIAMSSHCNLNCMGCDTYSPLSKVEFVTYDQLINDLKHLKKINDNTDKMGFGFKGGEPLLNPEFEKIFQKVVEMFPKGQKTIVTNGLLLNSKDESFWKMLKDANATLHVSKYPININRDRYENFAKKYNITINYDVLNSDRMFDLNTKQVIDNNYKQRGFAWGKNILDLSGSEDPMKKCPDRGIVVYSRGNFYACYVHAFINAFIEYFNVDIQIKENESLKVSQIKSIDEFFKFIEAPKDLCRYCKQCHNTCFGEKELEWNFSKKEITEWT